MKQAILFVCLGNICRSPTAEAVFRKLSAQAGQSHLIDSAGTGGWHQGEAPHPPMIAAAKARGYDLTPLRARQITREDFHRFDHILVMDRSNLENVERLRAGKGTAPKLFLDYAPETGLTEVPDPYYTGTYDQTITLCEAAARGLIRDLTP